MATEASFIKYPQTFYIVRSGCLDRREILNEVSIVQGMYFWAPNSSISIHLGDVSYCKMNRLYDFFHAVVI